MRSSLETCTGLKMMSQDAVLYVSLSTLQLMPFTMTELSQTCQCPGHTYKITGLKKREKGCVSEGTESAHIYHLLVWVLQNDPMAYLSVKCHILKMKNKYMNCPCNKKCRSDLLMSCSSMQGRAGFNCRTFSLKLLNTSVLVRGNLHCSFSASGT